MIEKLKNKVSSLEIELEYKRKRDAEEEEKKWKKREEEDDVSISLGSPILQYGDLYFCPLLNLYLNLIKSCSLSII